MALRKPFALKGRGHPALIGTLGEPEGPQTVTFREPRGNQHIIVSWLGLLGQFKQGNVEARHFRGQ